MNKKCLSWLGRPALPTAALVLATTAAMAAPELPPSPPAAPTVSPDADLDAQLEAARKRLEQAAHEVARLSAQMSGSLIEHFTPYVDVGHALIGVQLEPAAGAAGARVREVSPGGAAAEAGIRVGDVIVAVNGSDLRGAEPAREVVRIMRTVKPDTKVTVRVVREGVTRDFTVTTRPGPAVFLTAHGLPDMDFGWLPELPGALMFHGPLTDMELATLTPRLGSYFGSERGVLVVRAPADGALKLEDGDVILAIDGREPSSGSHATRIFGSYQPGEKITLRILRQRKTQELETALPAKGEHRPDVMWREASPRDAPPGPKVLIIGRDAA